MWTILHYWTVAAACFGVTWVSGIAPGQSDYPTRLIRFLVGVVPGGASDILARALGQELSERFSDSDG